MYTFVLGFHNILRWIVLLSLFAMVFRCWQGFATRGSWGVFENILGRVLVIAIDTQLLVGLILYVFLSPTTRAAFSDFGSAMRTPNIRFFAVEHVVVMLIVLALVHVGWVSVKRADEAAKYRHGALWLTLALIGLFFGIPWDRALLPGL